MTLITEDLVEKLGISNEARQLFQKRPPKGVTGHPLPIIGTILLDIQIGKTLVKQHPTHIMRTPKSEFLIGTDFLAKIGSFSMNFERRTLSLNNESVPLIGNTDGIQPPFADPEVVSFTSVTNTPRTEAVLPCAVAGSNLTTEYLFEPNHRYFGSLGLQAASTLVHICEHTVPLRILNPHSYGISIREYATLGFLEPLTEQTTIYNIDCNFHNATVAPTIPLNKPHEFDLTDTALNAEEQERFRTFLQENSDVFAFTDSQLSTCPYIKHNINTGNTLPIKQRAYRVPICEGAKIKQHIDTMLENDIIRPSASPWASPVVLVKKKNGLDRFCVDYRKVNHVTKRDVYPLPRIDDILDSVGHSNYFSTLDLRSGYWQIEMSETDKEKTAFTTFYGLFEFNVLPFGLSNAPSTFQRLMEVVLAGLNWKICAVYLDDVVTFSSSFEQHLTDLGQVFDALRTADLKLQPKKCQFARSSINFLGHRLSPSGISPEPQKLAAVHEIPPPTSREEVKSFMGLASYYRRFVQGFAKIADPLHLLLRKNHPFQWKPAQESAFQALKKALTSAPILRFPDFTKTFYLYTDASKLGIGAVLSQLDDDGHDHPVMYLSRTLKPAEKSYPTIEWEALAVVWSVKTLRHYLLGRKFTIVTDHAPLRWLMSPNHMSQRLTKWSLSLQEFDFDIQYRSGKQNFNADALSRALSVNLVHGPDTNAPSELNRSQQNIRTEQEEDMSLAPLIAYLRDGTLPVDDTTARQTILESERYVILDNLLHHIR
ncbi:MAG: RNase H-like domain-containing protein, partial [Pirellulales bacterium]